jgi:two-component system phosphate regulon response regulator OmpR
METTTPIHILVVDDDAQIRHLLKQFLESNGYRATAVADGTAMNKQLQREPFDLLVLDLMLPREDGLAICRRLRDSGTTTPIVMLTAKGSDHDRILGLDTGADDYLPKPFNPRELLARIQAVLRRVPRTPPGAPVADAKCVQFGPFVLNMVTRALAREGTPVPLTNGDFALLKTLAMQPHQPLSREKLAKLARGREHGPYDRNVDVRISRLRKLIEADIDRPSYIQTVWGFGYVFVPDAK